METQTNGQIMRLSSQQFAKRLFQLAGAGGIAFWIVDYAISVSPIGLEYRTAFSISNLPLALAGALIGGLIIACCVSNILLRFFEKIPTKNPMFKALILSFGAMIMFEVLSALGDPTHASVYLIVDTGMNLPRFLALGIVIGYLYDKLK